MTIKYIRSAWRLLSRLPRQMLKIDLFRFIWCLVRYAVLVVLLRRQRTFEDGSAAIAPVTIKHNLKGVIDLAVARSSRLILPLAALDRVRFGIEKKQILTIGPRSEGEIYNLRAEGFSLGNITGLDLISYSPYVQLGDMHAMPFADDSFDILIASCVLAYSNDRRRAAQEIIRVVRPGGIVAVSAEYVSQKEGEALFEYDQSKGWPEEVIRDLTYLVALFDDHVEYRYFQQDADSGIEGERGTILLIFRVRK